MNRTLNTALTLQVTLQVAATPQLAKYKDGLPSTSGPTEACHILGSWILHYSVAAVVTAVAVTCVS